MIKKRVDLGDKFIPDLSVGQHWGNHWTGNNLDNVYGQRIKATKPPQTISVRPSGMKVAWVYADEALPEFRDWVRKTCLAEKMPKYLADKVKKGEVGGLVAQKALAALEVKKAPRLTH